MPPLKKEDRSFSFRHAGLILLLAMSAAGGVQAVYWLRVNPALGGDTLRYFYLGEAWLGGDLRHALHYHYPPLYPLFVTPFLNLASQAETAGRLAGVVIAMLMPVPVYFLSLQLFNRRAAGLAAVFLSFQFFIIYLPADAQALLNLSLYSALATGFAAIRRGSAGYAGITGFLFGLTALVKSEGQLYFLLWLGFLAASFFRQGERRKKAAALLGSGSIAFLLPLSPWVGAYYYETGRFSLNPKFLPLFYGHNEPVWNEAWFGIRQDEKGLYTLSQRVIAEGDREPFRLSLFSYMSANKGRLGRTYLHRLSFTLREIVPSHLWFLFPGSTLVGAGIVLAGLLHRWGKEELWKEFYLWSVGLATLFTVPLFQPEFRFFTPISPLFTIAFARGIERLSTGGSELISRTRWSKGKERTRLGLILALAAIVLLPNLHLLFRLPPEIDYHLQVEERKQVAQWLRRVLPPGRKMMSRWGILPFWYYAGLEPERDLSLPVGTVDEVIAYGRWQGADLMVVENHPDFQERYPLLSPLLHPEFNSASLRRLHTFRGAAGRIYIIYALLPPPSAPTPSGEKP